MKKPKNFHRFFFFDRCAYSLRQHSYETIHNFTIVIIQYNITIGLSGEIYNVENNHINFLIICYVLNTWVRFMVYVNLISKMFILLSGVARWEKAQDKLTRPYN